MRLMWRVLLVLGALVLVTVALVARMFVWPPQPSVGGIDAVVMLSGDHGERLPLALRVVREDPGRVLVLVGEPDTQQAVALCGGGEAFEVVCLRPNPDSTRAEARATAALATVRGWKKIAVVTSSYHVTRARMLFRRCVDADVVALNGRPPYGLGMAARQVLREVPASLYLATVDRSC